MCIIYLPLVRLEENMLCDVMKKLNMKNVLVYYAIIKATNINHNLTKFWTNSWSFIINVFIKRMLQR